MPLNTVTDKKTRGKALENQRKQHNESSSWIPHLEISSQVVIGNQKRERKSHLLGSFSISSHVGVKEFDMSTLLYILKVSLKLQVFSHEWGKHSLSASLAILLFYFTHFLCMMNAFCHFMVDDVKHCLYYRRLLLLLCLSFPLIEQFIFYFSCFSLSHFKY